MKQRESNFELLRLVAILFVIMNHLVIKGCDTVGYITPYNFEQHGVGGVIINSFCVCAVNLFLLVTGWFGVKKNFKGLTRLVIDCVVFGTMSYLALCTFFEHGFNVVECLRSSLFSGNRFVSVYMMLLLVSPLIERGIENIDTLQFRKFIILFTIVEVVFGFVFNYSDGYDLVHFSYMYCLARYLRLSSDEKWNITFCKFSLPIYLLTSVGLAALFIFLNIMMYRNSMRCFRYNDPLIILTASSLFMFFSKIKISSAVVNMLATGVFGTYILHTTPFLIPIRNEQTHQIFLQYGYVGVFVVCCLLFVVCCLLSVPVSKLTQKITKWICGIFDGIIDIFQK